MYSRNPNVTAREKPEYCKIRIKNVPISADDGQIFRFLEVCRLNIHNYHRERLRVNGFLTNCQTGDRIFVCAPLKSNLPRFIKISKYHALLINKWQVVIDSRKQQIKCNKCFETGHKQYECTSDWTCKQCGKT